MNKQMRSLKIFIYSTFLCVCIYGENEHNRTVKKDDIIRSKYEYVYIVTLSFHVIVLQIKQNNDFLRMYHIQWI